MTETINKLQQLLGTGLEYLAQSSESEINQKVSIEKWSKKEILGHLIDSGINNIQRFTEIQFENKPFFIRKYKQDALVKANDYQNSETKQLVELWYSINNRILHLIKIQTEKTLNYKIELEKGIISDLKYLMKDYVDHVEHHLKQIMK